MDKMNEEKKTKKIKKQKIPKQWGKKKQPTTT